MAGLGFGAQKVVMSAAVQPATRSWCWKRPAQTEHEWFMLLPHTSRGRSDGAQAAGARTAWTGPAHKGKPPALWPSQWVAVRALLQVLLPESAQRTAAASSSQACVVVVPPMGGPGPWRLARGLAEQGVGRCR